MRHVIVSVSDDRVDDLSAVVADLRRAGLTVTGVHADIGVVTGTVDGGALASLSTVSGVVDVEEQRGYRLPPPDSPVQ